MATGDLSQFGAVRHLPVWHKYEITADGIPVGLNGPCLVGSIYCITGGTIAGLYNSAGATGPNWASGVVMTARQRIDFAGGRGVRFGAVYLDITSGTYLLLAAPGG